MNKYTEAIDTFDFFFGGGICGNTAQLLCVSRHAMLNYLIDDVPLIGTDWRAFWLAFADLCAEVDDETIEALRTDIIQG